MSERAQALEAALRTLANAASATAAEAYARGDHRWHVVDTITAVTAAERLLAVKAPAEGVSPQPDDLAELWRQKLYPHIGPEVFRELLCDLTEKGWDDIRQEVCALQSIVDSRPAPVSPVEPTAPTQAGRIDQTPFVDTPVKQAKRRAFDDPTIANLDALADAALSVGSKPLRDALERIRTITQGVAPAEAINAVAEVWSISRDALSMRTHQ